MMIMRVKSLRDLIILNVRHLITEIQLIKLQGNKNKVTVILLSIIHRASKQKICKAVENLNNIVDQLDLLIFMQHSIQ